MILTAQLAWIPPSYSLLACFASPDSHTCQCPDTCMRSQALELAHYSFWRLWCLWVRPQVFCQFLFLLCFQIMFGWRQLLFLSGLGNRRIFTQIVFPLEHKSRLEVFRYDSTTSLRYPEIWQHSAYLNTVSNAGVLHHLSRCPSFVFGRLHGSLSSFTWAIFSCSSVSLQEPSWHWSSPLISCLWIFRPSYLPSSGQSFASWATSFVSLIS